MNADHLLAHYAQIADAAEAIPRLRRFILDLAVRGKLVDQDSNDEPAAELLKQIAAEKARLARLKLVKARRATGPATHSVLPFEPPTGWSPVRVEQILVELQTGPFGSSLHQSDYKLGGVPVVNPASIQNERIVPVGKMAVGPATLARLALFVLQTDDVILARRGEMGRCAVVTERESGWLCGTGSLILRPFKCIYTRFLSMLIGSPFSRQYLSGTAVGTTMQNLNQTILLNLPFGLPPLAEQHRIVAKVDELMVLCDRLEVARAEREATRNWLAAASLARLGAPDSDPAAFQNHAAFAVNNLAPLTTRPDQIEALRQTILNLAVRGKLVEQDPADEPASELLKRIASEKARLVKAGEIRKPKIIPTIPGGDVRFPLPANWRWSYIAEIGVLSPRNDADDHVQSSFVPMPLIASGYGLTVRHKVRRWGEIKRGYTHFAEGDVGLAKITPCFENGKSAVFRNLTGGFGSGTTELHIVRPIFVDPDHILIFLKCPHFIESGIPKMTGTAGQKRVPTDYFASSPFPLPPLAEQHRIVAKVNELMALCDRLEASLATADTTRARLLEALLHEALASAEEREAAA